MSERSARLDGKAALVTGGTRGIGLAIARRFCEEGARVVIAGTAQGSGAVVAEKLADQGALISFEAVDMADTQSVKRLAGAAAAKLSGLDIVVNNAGISVRDTINKLTEATWDDVLKVNLQGPVFCMQAASRLMERGGSIVNIASIAALDAPFGKAAYAASKAGLIAASQVAAKEFAHNQIRVNVVAPGIVKTDMTATIAPKYMEGFVADTPLKRVGMPEEIANACVYLASDEAQFVTGALLRIDGGLRF